MKKKVLLISESVGGGLRKHIVQLIEHLDEDKFELYFIHGTKTLDDVFLSRYESLKLRAKLIPCNSFVREINPKKDVASYQFVAEKIREINPDIVHCHSSKAGVIGRIAAKRHKVKKIFYTPHAYSFLAPEFSTKKKELFIGIEKLLSRFATTKTFCVSNGEKQAALSNYLGDKDNFEVIYNGLPEIQLPRKEEIKQQLGFKPADFIIGNNARMSDQKNPMLFMKIAKEVIQKDKNYHFVWVGEEPLLNRISSFVKENNLQNNIHLLGHRNDTETLVVAYDIFLITSQYEGLPYAPIEAMRAAVPILATNVVGNNEVVIPNENGEFIDLSVDVYKLISSIKNNTEYSINAKKIFENQFLIAVMIQKLQKNYLG